MAPKIRRPRGQPQFMPRVRCYLVRRDGERKLVYTLYGECAINGGIGNTLSYLFHVHFNRGHESGAIEMTRDLWKVGTLG